MLTNNFKFKYKGKIFFVYPEYDNQYDNQYYIEVVRSQQWGVESQNTLIIEGKTRLEVVSNAYKQIFG